MDKLQLRRTKQCWSDMKQRCYNKNRKNYFRYGGRGITVCDRWLESFDNFFQDMGMKPDGFSIERINNNENYNPNNCKWATNYEQQTNKSNTNLIEFDGKKMTLRAWAKLLGIHETTLSYRLKQPYPMDIVFTAGSFKSGGMAAAQARNAK